MLNISNFLGSGETSLFSSRSSLIGKAASVLAIPLIIGALTAGCAPTPDAQQMGSAFSLTGAHASEAQADVFVSSPGHSAPYAADGTTLLYQAVVDPGLTRVNVVSPTSEYLGEFMAGMSANVKALPIGQDFDNAKLGDYPSEAFGQKVAEYGHHQSGVSFSFHDDHGPSSCFVVSAGVSREFTSGNQPAEYVDHGDGLYVAAGSQHEAFIMLHELTHCYPATKMTEPEGNLGPLYRNSVFEMRSDLAVVLYAASKTGSFKSGLDAIGAFRGPLSKSPTHLTVQMLDVAVQNLDAKSFVGMPVNEVIASAVKIVQDLEPGTNSQLRLAFAKEAFINRTLIGQGPNGENIRQGYGAYARLGGKKFEVNVADYASKVIDRSLDNAMQNAGAVRASKALTVERVEAFAAKLGGTLSPEQLRKAKLLDAALTPGAKLDSTVQQSPISLSALETEANASLQQMQRDGLIARHGQAAGGGHAQRLADGASDGDGSGHGRNMTKKFGQMLKNVEKAVEIIADSHVKPHSPRM